MLLEYVEWLEARGMITPSHSIAPRKRRRERTPRAEVVKKGEISEEEEEADNEVVIVKHLVPAPIGQKRGRPKAHGSEEEDIKPKLELKKEIKVEEESEDVSMLVSPS
ncbi:hypothetical protein RhiJN_20303 [Ceratobasidium sp. AG-Ba]|nr:hypothetical protein RhiJN_20303 [Ceratobasidium sp. AG-Ba]